MGLPPTKTYEERVAAPTVREGVAGARFFNGQPDFRTTFSSNSIRLDGTEPKLGVHAVVGGVGVLVLCLLGDISFHQTPILFRPVSIHPEFASEVLLECLRFIPTELQQGCAHFPGCSFVPIRTH